MSEGQSPGSVELADNRSASTLLFDLVKGAVEHFPQGFAGFEIQGDAAAFRKTYSKLLPQFEAARLASAQRYEIASYLVDQLNEQIVWQADNKTQPLRQMLQNPVAPLPLHKHDFAGSPGWRPGFVYRGQRWGAAQFGELAAQLVQRHVITTAAGEALTWVGQDLLSDGALNLQGRKIAVMGAGRILQVGDPATVYDQPQEIAVAKAIGTPAMNWLAADTVDGWIRLNDPTLAMSGTVRVDADASCDGVILGVRPGGFLLTRKDEREQPNAIPGLHLSTKLLDCRIVQETVEIVVRFADTEWTAVFNRKDCGQLPTPGELIFLCVPADALHVFSASTQRRLDISLVG